MNLFTKAMNNFIPKAKEESLVNNVASDEPPNKPVEAMPAHKLQVDQKQYLDFKPTLKGTPHTISYPRTKMVQVETSTRMVNVVSSPISGGIVPGGTLFKADQPAPKEEILVDCGVTIEDSTKQCLAEPLSKDLKLNPEELEQLIGFLEDIELRRKKQQREKQEKRSAEIARKIHSISGGGIYLSENSIVFSQTEVDHEDWYQVVTIDKCNGEIDEITQTLNFFNPQHSWILENWLSQQSVSWTVRRSYNMETKQVIFQVSFGFPNQTFLEAEGQSREAAIISVAEDLLS